MRFSASFMTRRAALRLGAAGLGAAALAGPAFASPGASFPMRIAYVRVSPAGFVLIRAGEQEIWSRMAARMTGLIETLTPLQPAGMFGGLPHTEGEASCVLIARQMAAAGGYNQLILYATQDGQNTRAAYDNWFSETFARLTSDMLKNDRATGEAHLFDVHGGPPLASAIADAAPRDPLNLFDNGRNPEREVLANLTSAMERRLQDIAAQAYENSRSIAD